MLKRKSTNYDVKVTENSKGYKVVVTEKEVETTRNTRVSGSPLKALTGGKLNLRVIAGKKKEVSSVKDKDEIILPLTDWKPKLEKWVEVEGFNDSVRKEIIEKIEKLVYINS
ncbi:MAG: hypothetical protein ACRC4M_04215 [Mycoplasma sp.]